MAAFDQERAWRDLRVGVVTFIAGSILITGVVLAGGDKGLLFRKTSLLKAQLVNIGGLKKGSAVAIGGMIVGKVTEIRFLADGAVKNQIEVTMQIREDIRQRIKADSVPAVRTQGMLGDRYVDISTGTESAPVLAEGSPLIGQSATDFDETLRQAQLVLNEVQKTLAAINERQGTVGQLFYDERLYGNLTEFSDQLNDLIKDFKSHPRRYIKFSVF